MGARAREDAREGRRARGRGQGAQARGASAFLSLSFVSLRLYDQQADSSSRTLSLARSQNKDLAASRDSAQSSYDDLAEQVEHSLLDKEIAETELDEARARLKELEERVGELEVEVEVVKEENGASACLPSSSLSLPLAATVEKSSLTVSPSYRSAPRGPRRRRDCALGGRARRRRRALFRQRTFVARLPPTREAERAAQGCARPVRRLFHLLRLTLAL